MATRISTISASELVDFTEDPTRGVVSLVGDHGGLSLITGEINDSSAIFGTMAVETEHGTVFLDPEAQILVSEEDGQQRSLDERIPGSLYALNDILTAHLAERFGWYTHDDVRDEALNDLTHTVAEAFDDLLEHHPAQEATNA